MKEYTLLSLASVLVAICADKIFKTDILKQRMFYLFLAVILLFKLMVNGYLTGQDIVVYNPAYFLGVRLGSIPVEDFLFGFSMVTLTIIFWEYFKRRDK